MDGKVEGLDFCVASSAPSPRFEPSFDGMPATPVFCTEGVIEISFGEVRDNWALIDPQ